MNFHRHVGHTRRRRVNFSKNLRAWLFNDDLSSEPNFRRINLAGQYLL
jgi:hypothetical protein